MHEKVILGGTFDTLHEGHKKLLRKALSAGRRVYIGLTSDEFVRRNKKHRCASFKLRMRNLKKFLGNELKRVEIFKLDDFYGPAVDGEFDAIVVSEETRQRAEEINRMRRSRGLKELEIISIPLLAGEDLKKISCERVKKGVIDVAGRRRKPVLIAVGSTNPSKLKGVERVAKKIFKKFKLVGVEVKTKISSQPFEEETITGAIERAKAAREKLKADYGVGLESGLFKFSDKFFDCQWCAVYDGETTTLGFSMGFEVPAELIQEIIKDRKTMSEVFEKLSGIDEIGKKKGAIGYLSKGLTERREMSEQAFLCAIIPRIHKTINI
ncbi:MAG: inosine/xanthosine triphosphatase [Candidatus Micrarchaeia archaeon]